MARLQEYRRKREFQKTPEPSGASRAQGGNRFVVQEHHARRLHYDFRLEIDGVLKSWAVPKGPSMNPSDKRLAVQTEDHPLEYATFHGTIPAGQYGAGEVKIWDHGRFEPEGHLAASDQLRRGELKFVLHGKRLHGGFVLVKLRNRDRAKPEWLLIKHRDGAAQPKQASEIPAHGASGGVLSTVASNRARVSGEPKPRASARIKMPVEARAAPMPRFIRPALARLIDKPFSGPEWLFEVKWDGVRTLAQIRDGDVQLWSRSERDITGEYPELAELPKHVDAGKAWLDGEIVVLDSEGRSDFQKLQLRFGVRHPTEQLIAKSPAVYYVFDLLYLDGKDLRNAPLLERKNLLRRILRDDATVRYSDHVFDKGAELFKIAAQRKLEGIIAKKISSPYPTGRSTAWLKIKLDQELDAVVGGWTDPRGSREYFGALLLGLYEGGQLQYIGSVGSGFSVETQQRFWPQLQNLRSRVSPFAEPPDTRERAYFIQPGLVARVRFGNWTDDRHLRQPRFLGLHEDHDPRECTFESQMNAAPAASIRTGMDSRENSARQPRSNSHKVTARKRPGQLEIDGDAGIENELSRGTEEEIFIRVDGRELRLTNLNKIYFPENGYRKRDLLAYYFWAAPIILPFLKDRPLVLRRYPNGIHGVPFFQKDAGKDTPDWVKTVAIASESGRHSGGTVHYVVANDRATLLYLTNLGCIDHNPWSNRYDDQDHPDYAFFDLDPSEGATFGDVIRFARLLLETLGKMGLKAYPKTSGATGFHIYVPIEPQYTFEQVRLFVQAIADIVARKHPGVLTSQRTVTKRARGSIYMDAHQNSRGQSLACVYSVRARSQAPISTPVRIEELRGTLKPERWNLKTIRRRVEEVGDLWADFWKNRQKLETVFSHENFTG